MFHISLLHFAYTLVHSMCVCVREVGLKFFFGMFLSYTREDI